MGGRLELQVAGHGGGVRRRGAGRGPAAPCRQSLEAGELVWWGGGARRAGGCSTSWPGSWRWRCAWHDVEAALRRERVGQLLLLVGDRMLDPAALVQQLDEAGLGVDSLVVSAWPGWAAPLLLPRLRPALVGEAPGITLAVTSSAQRGDPDRSALTVPCGYGSALPLGRLSQGIIAGPRRPRAGGDARWRRGARGPHDARGAAGAAAARPARALRRPADDPAGALDRRHGTHHVDTLRAFLRHDGSLQQTAREQYLHVNTVRHRLARVHELTGRNPLVFADRVALAIALWTLDRRRSSASRVS
jgi:hypothetical protein